MATEESVDVPTVHEDDRKLFVGALPQEAKDTDIKEYFETYGEVEAINLKIDNMTGRSRGFAFLVFKTVEGIEAALQQEAHVVKGKKVTCKKAEARQGKIYVGKLPPGEAMSNDDIKAHFEQFGEVVEVVRPVDKQKNNEPKTFCFITFAKEDAAKQLVKQGSTMAGENTLEIKKVTPKGQNDQMGGGALQDMEVEAGDMIHMVMEAMEVMVILMEDMEEVGEHKVMEEHQEVEQEEK